MRIMVSSGTVHADLAAATACLENFASSVSGLSGSWKGSSFDSLQSQVSEASSTCTSTLSGQMSSFASACDLYEKYVQTKQQLASARSSYYSAKQNNTGEASKYASRINELSTSLETMKQQIEGLLASASGGSITATSLSGSSSAPAGGGETTGTDATTTTGTDSKSSGSTTTTSTAKDWTKDSNFVYYNQGAGWNDYEFSAGGKDTMKNTGCGPTSMAMVLSSLGYDVNPNTAAAWGTKMGFHVDGTAEGYFTSYAKKMGVQSKVLGKSADNIKTALNNNELVVLFVGPGDFTDRGHYIVARGYDSSTNRVLIADPDNTNNNKWYDLNRVVSQLKGKQSSWSFSNDTSQTQTS